jgi:hypothetical protein
MLSRTIVSVLVGQLRQILARFFSVTQEVSKVSAIRIDRVGFITVFQIFQFVLVCIVRHCVGRSVSVQAVLFCFGRIDRAYRLGLVCAPVPYCSARV